MLTLFLQTLALLLAAYFVGAWIGCLVRRTFFPITEEAAIPAYREATAPAPRVESIPAPVRRPDPIRPKIETIDRPAPTTERFADALAGPGSKVTAPVAKPVIEPAPVAVAPKPAPVQPAAPIAAVAAVAAVAPIVKPAAPTVQAPPSAPIAKAPDIAKPMAPVAQQVTAPQVVDTTRAAPVAKAAEVAASMPEHKPVVTGERAVVAPGPREVTAPAIPAVPVAGAIDPAAKVTSAAVTAAELARSAIAQTPAAPVVAAFDAPRVSPGQTALTASVVAAAAAAVAAANRATSQPVRPETTNLAPGGSGNLAAPVAAKPPVAADKPEAKPDTAAAAVPPGQRMVLPVAAGSGGHGSVSAQIVHPPARVQAPSDAVQPSVVAPPAVAAAAPTRMDDLTRIRGIDADLAARLKSLGITSFTEISGWKPSDVLRVNTMLGAKGRVEQENWIEQAQILGKGEDTFYSKGGMAPAAPLAQPSKDEGQSKPIVAAPARTEPVAPVAASVPDVESRAAFAAPKSVAPIAPVVAPATLKETVAAVVAPVVAVAAPAAAVVAAVVAPKVTAPVVVPSPVVAPVVKPVVSPIATAPRVMAAGGRDSLQRIAGVNAEVEKLLQVQGVTRYSQIAGWTDADLMRFDRLLGREGRIKSENWVEQAQILARGGETAFSREHDKRESMVAPAVAAPAQVVKADPAPATPMAPVGAIAAALAPAAAVVAATVAPAVTAKPSDPVAPVAPDSSRPARLADAIRDSGRVIGSGQAARPGDLSSLRSVRSEAYRPVDTTAPTAVAGAAAAGAAASRVGRSAGSDDLKRIRGVGVLIEKKLNSMGVTSYDQIARWTQADIEKISTTLDFKGRIERENWIEQARILAEGGQTEFSRRVDTGEVDGKPRT